MLELGGNVDLVDVSRGSPCSISATLAATGTLADCVGFDSTLGSWPYENALLSWLTSIAHLTRVLLHRLCLLICTIRRCLTILSVTEDKGPVNVTARLVELDSLPSIFRSLRRVSCLSDYCSASIVVLYRGSLILMNRPFDLVLTESKR